MCGPLLLFQYSLPSTHLTYFTLKKEKVSVTALSLPCLTAVLVLVLPAFVLQTFKCVLHSSDKRTREKTKKCSAPSKSAVVETHPLKR